jgi:hypothetical protein
MRRVFVVAVFVLIVCASQAIASEGQFSLYVGYEYAGVLNVYKQGTPFQFHSSGLYGGRAEWIGAKYYGLEVNAGYSNRFLNDKSFLGAAGKEVGRGSQVSGFYQSTNFVANLPFKIKVTKYIPSFTPFVTFGVGFIMPMASFDTFHTTAAGNYGGGLKMDRIYGPFGLRLDCRQWRTHGINITGKDYGGVNLLEASAGITYKIGKK